jgi:heat shock protein HtpX
LPFYSFLPEVIPLHDKTEACPGCGHELPVNPGYITWCEHCNWNIDADELRSRRERLWTRINVWLGSKRNHAIFEEVRGELAAGYQLTPSRAMAYGFATMWYGLVMWVAYSTISTFIHTETLGDFIIGIILASLTYVLIPRVYRLKEPTLDRAQYPAIYKIADEASALLGADPIDGIVVHQSFNASYTISGFRRKKLLIIGLPLFSSLNPEEKLAVIAHEIGHHANRDITRSSFLGGVQRALGRLFVSLYPDTDYSDEVALLAIPLDWLRKGLAYIVLVLWYAMGLAVWKDSQRAEYYADYSAASVAGTRATVSALKKMLYAPTFYKTIETVAQYQYSASLFDEFRGRIRAVPTREVERIRILTEIMESGIEQTHPPTRYRTAYIEEKLSGSMSVIPSELLTRMEEEFQSLEAEWGPRLVTDYRSYLYDTF